MTIISIGGFLGSGKTTLLLALAGEFDSRGYSIAAIENEIGEVPVDSTILVKEGLRVRELYSGCICCSMRDDLESMVREVRKEINPDILLVEPSGVAGPDIVTEALQRSALPDERVRSLMLIDYRRAAAAPALDQFFLRTPFLERALRVCDIPVINRPQEVDPDFLGILTARLKAMHPGNEGIELNACSDARIGALADSLLDTPFAREAMEVQVDVVPGNHRNTAAGQAAAVAESCDLDLDSSQLADTDCALEQLVKGIGADLGDMAGEPFGHVKAVLAADYGCVRMNLTDFRRAEIYRCGSPLQAGPASLVLNAVAYGIDREALEGVVSYRWEELLKAVQKS